MLLSHDKNMKQKTWIREWRSLSRGDVVFVLSEYGFNEQIEADKLLKILWEMLIGHQTF